ncbi:hypothetical protein [Devosia sp. RR2S18]|uniref:hypothetical protein n=1 Tax=Devosia rhizosphaerae TaxID=3049774 RepID=UPI0025420250|nr:hypothetical protein [Devosia sp. RR2S18]WIJ26360.1 hypothetical protein QOV41_06250 [Devosia sp. RR2S18]
MSPLNHLRPLYLLNVDEPDPRSIVLVVRTDDAGVTTGEIKLPKWEELPPGFDGPHEIDTAIKLADSYAEAYGYRAIAIDIESSQLWRGEWGELQR